MGFAAERQLIESTFDNDWLNGAYVHVPVRYENIEFIPPANNEPWVDFSIGSSDADAASLSARIVRHEGEVTVDIYVPQGEGTNEARQLADEVSRILRNRQISSTNAGYITFGEPDVAPMGAEEPYYKLQVTVDYERDEHTS